MCVEINTTRDISTQILRHRSFSFQEFSQRYAEVESLGPMVIPELRLQDSKNRQSSLQPPVSMIPTIEGFEIEILDLQEKCRDVYGRMVKAGVAKECARKILPIGSPSRLYMSGTIRSWIHYLKVRLGPETQKEHREVAEGVLDIFKLHCPVITESSCLIKSISQ
jgi:thymidylate synthase (FAD)